MLSVIVDQNSLAERSRVSWQAGKDKLYRSQYHIPNTQYTTKKKKNEVELNIKYYDY